MKKFVLAVFIGIVLGLNVYGIATSIYNKYFVEEEVVDVVPNVVEVIYVD